MSFLSRRNLRTSSRLSSPRIPGSNRCEAIRTNTLRNLLLVAGFCVTVLMLCSSVDTTFNHRRLLSCSQTQDKEDAPVVTILAVLAEILTMALCLAMLILYLNWTTSRLYSTPPDERTLEQLFLANKNQRFIVKHGWESHTRQAHLHVYYKDAQEWYLAKSFRAAMLAAVEKGKFVAKVDVLRGGEERSCFEESNPPSSFIPAGPHPSTELEAWIPYEHFADVYKFVEDYQRDHPDELLALIHPVTLGMHMYEDHCDDKLVFLHFDEKGRKKSQPEDFELTNTKGWIPFFNFFPKCFLHIVESLPEEEQYGLGCHGPFGADILSEYNHRTRLRSARWHSGLHLCAFYACYALWIQS